MNNNAKLPLILMSLVFLLLIIATGCFPSSSEQSASAQTNQLSNSSNNNQPDIEILRGVSPLCRYRDSGGEDFSFGNSSDNKLYELIQAGYPKEISVTDAVAVFRKAVECSEEAKSQPPLTVDELIAAIRDWDCTKEKDAANKKVCADAWKITETGKMPKGAFIDYNDGLGGEEYPRGKKGYQVKTYEIYLYLWLDKYRRDMRDEPLYSHLIRLTYISSVLPEPEKFPKQN